MLNQDLGLIEQHDGALDRLIEQLRLWRGSLMIRPEDFAGWSLGARFYPMLYLLTRVYGARDWASGLPLSANLLGKLSGLQVHHVFPRALLYRAGYPRSEVNSVANYCFLTQITNLEISAKSPEVYFEEVERNHPGALASQWIPMDRELWKVENYREFLKARRELLATAANNFLDELLNGVGTVQQIEYATVLQEPVAVVPEDDAEDREIRELIAWLEQRHLPQPELDLEVAVPGDGTATTIIDAAWPRGIQEGYSESVALLLNEDEHTEARVSEAGYRFFTSTASLRNYIEKEIEHVPAREYEVAVA